MAESPEAHTLFYNLGLIYFKLSRLEEAESAFLKALELSQENPKINFYLGSIYERLRRFQDAIYQYRQAGRQPHGAAGGGQDRRHDPAQRSPPGRSAKRPRRHRRVQGAATSRRPSKQKADARTEPAIAARQDAPARERPC